MANQLSQFGHQLSGESGIVNLMEDLGDALNVNPNILFLGGGNPAQVPEFEKRAAEHLKRITDSPEAFHKMVGIYQSPQGSEELIDALVVYFKNELGWNIGKENIVITNGSQSAFFMLINMLAGNHAEHTQAKQFCFPIMPEYLGYSDQGVANDVFVGNRPSIEYIDEHTFKYHIDFERLVVPDSAAALCVSRPTNPTGNVITDSELERLNQIAKQKNIPLIVDCAYGNPFPGVVYEQVSEMWHDNMISVMSLSKLGLPGARTGIVIANEAIVRRLTNMNTVISLASGSFGPSLMTSFLKSGELPSICNDILLPFYKKQKEFAVECVRKYLNGSQYYLHKPEGAFFLWLWFKGLPISTHELYERLKKRGVLIMAGEHFFFGLDEKWDHAGECIRITYCQKPEVIDRAIALIAEEVRLAFEKG